MKPNRLLRTIGLLGLYALAGCHSSAPEATADITSVDHSDEQVAFREALALPWQAVMHDAGTGDWRQQWFLDGKKARVLNGDNGMTLHAGPNPGEDASHAVLWTKASFREPIKIEYDYTRLDNSGHGVNILYLLATGSGEPPYTKDIVEWNDLRTVPAMREYVYNMNLYHISYAALTYDKATQQPTGNDYVRARRYMPATDTLRGTQIGDDYRGTGLFRQGVSHHIVVIKTGDWLLMEVTNDDQRQLFTFDTSALPPVDKGRVGFRQMFTRSARYSNIKISQLQP